MWHPAPVIKQNTQQVDVAGRSQFSLNFVVPVGSLNAKWFDFRGEIYLDNEIYNHFELYPTKNMQFSS